MRAAAWCVALATMAGEEPVLLATLPDGIELQGRPYLDPNGRQRIDRSTLVFDAAVTRVAYVGWRGERSLAISGDELLGDFDFLDEPLVPPAPLPVLFRAGDRTGKEQERWWLLANAKKTQPSDWIGAVACSEDGANVAWWEQPGAKLAKDGSRERGEQELCWNGKRIAKWADADSLEPPLFAPDGSRVAGIVEKNGWRVALASPKKAELQGDGKGLVRDLAWRPDGSGVVWCEAASIGPGARMLGAMAESAGAKFEIVAGKARLGKGFASCGAPVVAPDGRAIAYKFFQVVDTGGVICGRLGIGVDDAPRAASQFVAVDPLVWSADGRHLAAAVALAAAGAPEKEQNAVNFVARRYDRTAVKGTWHAWRDGATSEPWDDVHHVTWSPDGKRLAWVGARDGKQHVVVDGKAGAPWDEVGPLHFAADGKSLFFGALDGRKIVRATQSVAKE